MHKRRPVRLPKILTMQRDFAEVDKFMNAMERNSVDEAKFPDGSWRIAATTLDKETYCVLSAFEGWNECFQQIANALGDSAYSDVPLRSLLAKLKHDMPVTRGQVAKAKEVVELQRKLYMRAPPIAINTAVKTADALVTA